MVTITPSVLREQVEQGMKLDTLAEHYGLPKSQMKKALQQLGLKIRRLHEPKFVFAEEEETQSHHTTLEEDIPQSPNVENIAVEERQQLQKELNW
jgi:hypothetical protein